MQNKKKTKKKKNTKTTQFPNVRKQNNPSWVYMQLKPNDHSL